SLTFSRGGFHRIRRKHLASNHLFRSSFCSSRTLFHAKGAEPEASLSNPCWHLAGLGTFTHPVLLLHWESHLSIVFTHFWKRTMVDSWRLRGSGRWLTYLWFAADYSQFPWVTILPLLYAREIRINSYLFSRISRLASVGPPSECI